MQLGLVLFLEEDDIVAEDFLFVLYKMQKFAKKLCSHCNIFSLGSDLGSLKPNSTRDDNAYSKVSREFVIVTPVICLFFRFNMQLGQVNSMLLQSPSMQAPGLKSILALKSFAHTTIIIGTNHWTT